MHFERANRSRERRSRFNASLWDVMSTGLSRYEENLVQSRIEPLRQAIYTLLKKEEFNNAITYAPNDAERVRMRFQLAQKVFKEVLGAHTD